MTGPRRPWHVPRRWDPHADIVPVTRPTDQPVEASPPQPPGTGSAHETDHAYKTVDAHETLDAHKTVDAQEAAGEPQPPTDPPKDG